MHRVSSVFSAPHRDRVCRGAGSAKLSSCMDTTHSVPTQITLTVLIIPYTSCVVVISILLELIATIIMGMKTEGGDSDADQLEVSESSTTI